MNYEEQQRYLRASRRWALAIVALLLLTAAPPLWLPLFSRYSRLCYALIIVAIAASVLYTPDYLHLTVRDDKLLRWQVKIRWRLIAALLVLGLIPARSLAQVLVVLGSAAWLAMFNLRAPSFGRFCRRVGMPDLLPAYFLISDYLLIACWILLLRGFLPQIADFISRPSPLLMMVLLAASSHLVTVISRKAPIYAALAAVAAVLMFGFFFSTAIVITAFGTAFLVHRAQFRNYATVSAALGELKKFTGYSEARVRELWGTSDRQLAANWKSAKLDGATPEQLAAWYRDNSELYLFAISAYNLDYKRIVSNLGVLRLARGRTLDYGAGNGELLLELARRGHSVAYYDVEGVTMRFARYRAEQRGLRVDFFLKKSDLAAATAIQRDGGDHGDHAGFDTIFSFDVLEHLPDLAGELTFLASLLAPGGQFVFDIPAGATRNHPMHLDHQLDFIAHLRSLGLQQVLTWRDRLPWRKEEKYRFRRPI